MGGTISLVSQGIGWFVAELLLCGSSADGFIAGKVSLIIRQVFFLSDEYYFRAIRLVLFKNGYHYRTVSKPI